MRQRRKLQWDGYPAMAEFVESCAPLDWGQPTWIRLEPYTKWKEYNSITYVSGNRKSFNPCFHVKARVRQQASYGSSEVGTIAPAGGSQPINVTPDVLVSLVPRLSTAQVNGFLQEAVDQWTEQMPDVADLGVFLGELRKGVKEFLPRFDEIGQKISSSFLKYKFGVEPFVRDMGKFFRVYDVYQKRMKHLHGTHGQTVRSRFRRLDCLPGPYGDQWLQGMVHVPIQPGDPPMPCMMDFVDPMYVRARVTFHRTDFRAVGFISNELKGLDNTWDQVDAAAACLGLNNPFKILWNLAPWTFVVDWFADVSGFLDQLEGEPFGGKLILEGGGYSTKSWTTIEVEHTNPGLAYQPIKGEYHIIIYERVLGLGDATTDRFLRLFAGGPKSDPLSGDRPVVLLALLDQRMRKRSTKYEDLRYLLQAPQRVPKGK